MLHFVYMLRGNSVPVSRIRVFVGPTLPWDEAARHLEAEYWPPACFEDWELTSLRGVDVAVLIDSAFLDSATVNPNQILSALRQGIVVFGAASAGALRAVELTRFGMRGVGTIYELYRSGKLEEEEELYVNYDSGSLLPVTVPTINVRSTLQWLMHSDLIKINSAIALLQTAKRIHFSERTWARILDAALDQCEAYELEALKCVLKERWQEVDIKRQDAIDCLKSVREYMLRFRSVSVFGRA